MHFATKKLICWVLERSMARVVKYANAIFQFPFTMVFSLSRNLKRIFIDLPREERRRTLKLLQYRQNEQNGFLKLLATSSIAIEICKFLALSDIFKLLRVCHGLQDIIKQNPILWEAQIQYRYSDFLTPVIKLWKNRRLPPYDLCRRIAITESKSKSLIGTFSARVPHRSFDSFDSMSLNAKAFYFEFSECDTEPFKTITQT